MTPFKKPFSLVSAGVDMRRPTERSGDVAIVDTEQLCIGTLWGGYPGAEEVAKQALALLNAAPQQVLPALWRDEIQQLSMIASTAMHQTPMDMRNILEDLADRLATLAAGEQPPKD